MFGWEFPPNITGGLGTACFGLTKAMLKFGIEVLFVVPKAYGDEDKEVVKIINASDVAIQIKKELYEEYWKLMTYLQVGSNLIPYVGPEEFENIVKKKVLDRVEVKESIFSEHFEFSGKYGHDLMKEVQRYAVVANKISSENTFDVIHAHDWLTYPAGIAAKEKSGKPLIVHVHATEFDRSGENINQAVYDIEKTGMEAADMVITVSNFTRNIVISRYGINPDKVQTIHNGIEPVDESALINSKKHLKQKVVTFLGRVTFQKGPDYFVEVANKLIKRDKNIRFVMAGHGDMFNKMVRLVAKYRISSNFHFTGFLKGDDVDKMLQMTDVYVMPSVSEPFGISPLEAIRSNVPVVISKQSGVSEVLRHAIKVDFWDIDAMADAIHGLLKYKALSRMFINYGKNEVDNLKWDNAAFRVKEVYNNLIQNKS